MRHKLLGLVVALATLLVLIAACSGGNDGEGESADFETDLEALRELYPLGDIAVESVRWRYHNDFVVETEGSRNIPAQDAERIVEAIFVFEDDAIRSSALNGRTTTLNDIPAWYPAGLTGDDSIEISVSVDEVAGLPGTVAAFPAVSDFVLVRFTP